MSYGLAFTKVRYVRCLDSANTSREIDGESSSLIEDGGFEYKQHLLYLG